MSEFDELGFTPHSIDVPIPAKCEGFAVQCELRSEIASLLINKHLAEALGGTLVGEDGEEFDAMLEAHLPEEEAEAVKQGARQAMSQDIYRIDEAITTKQEEIDANALSCNGVLKMRASKGDVRYTVSVCTSPREYLRDSGKPAHLPTHIQPIR